MGLSIELKVLCRGPSGSSTPGQCGTSSRKLPEVYQAAEQSPGRRANGNRGEARLSRWRSRGRKESADRCSRLIGAARNEFPADTTVTLEVRAARREKKLVCRNPRSLLKWRHATDSQEGGPSLSRLCRDARLIAIAWRSGTESACGCGRRTSSSEASTRRRIINMPVDFAGRCLRRAGAAGPRGGLLGTAAGVRAISDSRSAGRMRRRCIPAIGSCRTLG